MKTSVEEIMPAKSILLLYQFKSADVSPALDGIMNLIVKISVKQIYQKILYYSKYKAYFSRRW